MISVPDLHRRLTALNCRTVAIQAPEGLKRLLPRLADDLHRLGYEVIISGDPCYGACDLDLDARDQADILVHIGHTPVDGTERVIYETWPVDGDISVIKEVIPRLTGKEAGLVTTVQHIHLLSQAASLLLDEGIKPIIAGPSPRTPCRGQVLGCSFEAARRTGAQEIIFLGTGLFHPIGIKLATGARVFACDPVTGNIEEPDSDRLLRVRFGLIQKAREADSYGIIVSSKTGQCRSQLADRLCSLSDKAYKVVLGEVTPDQLLNLGFPCYVNTACPRLAYDDQVRFPAPVLTPGEFEILCGVRDFDHYEVDEII
ncbi:MAG: diphthamide biosynthesis enzyme Dph2 [Methanomicrobiales archaeon]|nr:diphthamide biosynthesis enzyme Dph2 [Methanomicrobiales archaeon]